MKRRLVLKMTALLMQEERATVRMRLIGSLLGRCDCAEHGRHDQKGVQCHRNRVVESTVICVQCAARAPAFDGRNTKVLNAKWHQPRRKSKTKSAVSLRMFFRGIHS